MDPVEKAKWYIENNFRGEISLADVADAVSISKFHLARAFDLRTGYPVNRYIRARRLSEAAKRLVVEPTDILYLALDFGYGSHEAFTRAFRAQFGISPEQLREAGTLENFELVEPIRMNEDQFANLAEPKIVNGGDFLVVGLKCRYTEQSSSHIPDQWQQFARHIDSVPKQTGSSSIYGVLSNSDDEGGIDYLTAVEVESHSEIPEDLDGMQIPAHTYAVFEHRGHVSGIRRTWSTIFSKWLPTSGHRLIDGPQFEAYGDDFDPMTGNGRIEIWIPIAP